MAATQLIWGPSGEYNVIDNAAAPSGATAQSTNAFKNGTIPDFVATGSTTVLNSSLSTRLLFKNPS